MNIHEQVKHWEENEGVELFREIGIGEGAIVVDYGCGFGHYAKAAAIVAANSGKVYAIDKDKGIIKYLNEIVNQLGTTNIIPIQYKFDESLSFEDSTVDCFLLYDILHGEGLNRFLLYKEIGRVLKPNGILSILPFHMSNFRDADGKKKKYKAEHLIEEVTNHGFTLSSVVKDKGMHFERYHSPHFISKGGVSFEELERGTIYNFLCK